MTSRKNLHQKLGILGLNLTLATPLINHSDGAVTATFISVGWMPKPVSNLPFFPRFSDRELNPFETRSRLVKYFNYFCSYHQDFWRTTPNHGKIIKLVFVVFWWFGIVREPGQKINHHSNQDCLAKRWDERIDILRKGSGPRRCFQTFGQQIYIILIYYHYVTLHDLTWSSIILVFHDIISFRYILFMGQKSCTTRDVVQKLWRMWWKYQPQAVV